MIRFSNFHYKRESSYFLSQMNYTLTNLTLYQYILVIVKRLLEHRGNILLVIPSEHMEEFIFDVFILGIRHIITNIYSFYISNSKMPRMSFPN